MTLFPLSHLPLFRVGPLRLHTDGQRVVVADDEHAGGRRHAGLEDVAMTKVSLHEVQVQAGFVTHTTQR